MLGEIQCTYTLFVMNTITTILPQNNSNKIKRQSYKNQSNCSIFIVLPFIIYCSFYLFQTYEKDVSCILDKKLDVPDIDTIKSILALGKVNIVKEVISTPKRIIFHVYQNLRLINYWRYIVMIQLLVETLLFQRILLEICYS